MKGSVVKMKKEKAIKSEVVKMTPALAMEIMKNNTQNRPISPAFVKRFAKDMREGKWQVNGESIIIADDGTLLDGQHRLQAVLDSGLTVEMSVVRGVDKNAYQTIDIGRKRTAADAIATYDEKFLKNRGTIAAAIKVINSFTDSGVFDPNMNRGNLSHGEVIEFANKNYKQLSRAVDLATSLRWAKKLVPLSGLVALYFLFARKDISTAEVFFHKLDTGERMDKNDPVNLLRNRIMQIKSSGGVFRSREIIPYVVKAWELTREGREVSVLRVDNDYVPVIK